MPLLTSLIQHLPTRRSAGRLLVALVALICWLGAAPAGAQTADPVAPVDPVAPAEPGSSTVAPPSAASPDAAAPSLLDGSPGPDRAEGDATGDGGADGDGDGLGISIDFGGGDDGLDGEEEDKPSQVVTILLGLTVLAVAPSILLMMTSFTRIVVVLSLTRNALGVQAIPPNQVMVGLAMFLTFFVMAPVFTEVNDTALQPYLDGKISQSEGFEAAEVPIKDFMLANTRRSDLEMMIGMSGGEQPETRQDTSLVALVPAFVISELQSAFIIGIVLFVPFVVIDLVVSAVLMSLGMMMLPPVFVSLPLKLLVFVMVDGWALLAQTLVANYRGSG